MKKFYWVSLTVLLFAFTSCKNEESFVIEKSLADSKDISVVDGHLKFKDHAAFFRTLNQLVQVDKGKWSSQFSGFKSMAQSFKEFEDSNVMGIANPELIRKLFKH